MLCAYSQTNETSCFFHRYLNLTPPYGNTPFWCFCICNGNGSSTTPVVVWGNAKINVLLYQAVF